LFKETTKIHGAIFSIGAQIETDGSARSVGNPITMSTSGITQALNLKAAIEYQEGSGEYAITSFMSNTFENIFQ